MDTKKCSRCKEIKPITEFYKRKKSGTLHSCCKKCDRAMTRDWYERNREKAKEKYRIWRLNNLDKVKKYNADNRRKHYQQEVVRKYGVPIDWFDGQMKKQKGKCACCGMSFEWGNKQTSPHVDHCHKTQKVRGILCNRCNSVLGLCKDDIQLLSSLVRYLRKWHG